MKVLEPTEKEFKIINEIDKDLNITQRAISKNLGMSLGITNIILKRLVNKGYVKVKQLNKKKVQYILTPKGFNEKAKKSYHYTLRTIEILKIMKLKIQNFILNEFKKGQRKFIIYGKGGLAWLVEIAIRDLRKKDLVYKRMSGKHKMILHDRNDIILLTEQNRPKNIKAVDIISILNER